MVEDLLPVFSFDLVHHVEHLVVKAEACGIGPTSEAELVVSGVRLESHAGGRRDVVDLVSLSVGRGGGRIEDGSIRTGASVEASLVIDVTLGISGADQECSGLHGLSRCCVGTSHHLDRVHVAIHYVKGSAEASIFH